MTDLTGWSSVGSPSINFNGSKIACNGATDVGGYEIFVMNSDGSGKTQVTENYALTLKPSISADGSKVAFYSDADGDYEIYVVSSESPPPPPAEGLTLVHDKEWYWTSDTSVFSIAGGDVDGDRDLEIVTGGNYNDGSRNIAQLCVWE